MRKRGVLDLVLVFRIPHSAFCVALLLTARSSAAQPVGITGGADASGHAYSWEVRNDRTSPIVEVQFPHYRAGLFFPPKGWSGHCSALVQVGARDEPGVCTARADAPGDGISPGRSLTFSMQIASAGAKRGPGDVTVRFADGTETRIPGVELPQQEAAGDKNLPLFGLGGVFVTFIIAQAVRNRRRRVRRVDEERAAGTESH